MSSSLRESFKQEALLDYMDKLAISPPQQTLIQEFSEGTSTAALAESYSITDSAVRFIVSNYKKKVHTFLEMRQQIKPGPALEHLADSGLSKLEQEIVTMFADGHDYKEICENFNIEPRTVVRALTAFQRHNNEDYRSRRKTGVEDAHRLKALRMQRGLTIDQVSELVKLPSRTIIRLEQDAYKIPMELFCKLLKIYDFKVEDWM